jgi:hypothetical protein
VQHGLLWNLRRHFLWTVIHQEVRSASYAPFQRSWSILAPGADMLVDLDQKRAFRRPAYAADLTLINLRSSSPCILRAQWNCRCGALI